MVFNIELLNYTNEQIILIIKILRREGSNCAR
ncbi:hypothetical protein JOC37_002376 [Desulfohalotomaculum tongense]|nr:hypothetical protein [Desulforadius tongensis]